MTKSTNTKKALALSLMSMLVCAVMFVGSTFAWFTDTASADINKIQSGTLGIQLLNEAGESVEETPLEWVKAAGHEAEEVLWEPGCTYELPAVKIKNNGNLALKYKIAISGVTGDAKLLEAIDFTYKIGDEVLDLSAEGHLAAKAETELIKISGHMKETAGNEYQNKPIDSISLKVVATQDTVEADSKGNQYDKNAVYPVMDTGALTSSIKKSGIVVLGDDVVYDVNTNPGIDSKAARTTISSATTTLDLGGKTITFDSGAGNDNFAAFYLQSAKAKLTVNGEGTIDATATTGASCFHLTGNKMTKPTLTINGGTYIGNPSAVNVQYGTAYINGGFFNCKPAGTVEDDLYRYTLNCVDDNYKKGYAKIIVTGGTFVNFDPSNNQAEGPNTNFVADGYKVVSEQHGEDTWYTVVAE